MEKHKLEEIIHEEIPITLPMAIKVVDARKDRLALSMELQPNINHKSTAFGGSLYVLCVLTGWAYLYNRLHELKMNAHIVIQKSDIDYRSPVTSDFSASCESVDEVQIEKLVKTFSRADRARIELPVKILHAGKIAVSFHGNYVIHK